MNEVAKTPLHLLDRDVEHATYEIDGVPYEVVSTNGREAVSALYRYELTCHAGVADPSPTALIGKPCALSLHDGFGTHRAIGGVVASVRRMLRDQGSAELSVEMRPAVFPLSLSRDSRVFNDMTVPQIVDRVLHKLPAVRHRWELTRSYPVRVYTAQYREDDWTFISRLLEDEGIYYWFDHDDGSTLVMSDDSVHSAELVGGAGIDFVLDSGMLGDRELIHELGSEAHATATKFTVGSFDPWNPALKVQGSVGGGRHEHYDAPGGGPESPAACQRKAQERLDCARAHRAGISGNSSSVRLEPGRIAEVRQHPHLDGRYFVREVMVRVKQRQHQGGGGYECHFEALDAALPYRPREITPVSKQAGIQSGRVVGPPGEEIHTDDKGRVRVQLHWDREGGWDDKAGRWMRVAQRGVASSMLYPRVGWNVTTFMEEGNVDAPSVLSRVHDADHPPTYPLPANKTRTVFRTLTSPGGGSANEIRFEDLLGAQEMFLNASKDMNYTVLQNWGQNVGRNHSYVVGGTQDLTVGDTLKHHVQQSQTVSVGSDEIVKIKKDRGKTVGGNETETIGSDRKVEVFAGIGYTVKGSRTLQVTGSANEEATKGLIKVGANNGTIAISGQVSHDIGGTHNEDVGDGSVKSITASKTESCGKDWMVEVDKNLTETIGADLALSAGTNLVDASDETTIWTATGAINGTTSELRVEAKDWITLVCGGSTIKIEPTQVTITAPSYDLSQARTLIADTSKITHN